MKTPATHTNRGSCQWTATRGNAPWAKERMRGQILPLEPVKGVSWFKRLWGKV